MTYAYTLTTAGIDYAGSNYPLSKPEGFDTWLKSKQEAFIQGYLHAYVGTPSEEPQYKPSQEVSL